MGAYTTAIPENEEYKAIVETIRTGYTGIDGVDHKPAPHMAACVVVQSNLGCRIGDIVRLSLSSFVHNADGWHIDIIEEKTGKARRFPVPDAVYNYIAEYCQQNGIGLERRIFPFTARAIQKAIKNAADTLKIEKISTHSFRKLSISTVYDASGHDPEVAREFAQHGSVTTTQAYIRRSRERLNKAIALSVNLV